MRLAPQLLEVFREEARAAMREAPTPDSALHDLGFVLGSLSHEEALAFAKIAIKPLADFIDANLPDEEPAQPPQADGPRADIE